MLNKEKVRPLPRRYRVDKFRLVGRGIFLHIRDLLEGIFFLPEVFDNSLHSVEALCPPDSDRTDIACATKTREYSKHRDSRDDKDDKYAKNDCLKNGHGLYVIVLLFMLFCEMLIPSGMRPPGPLRYV